MFASGDEPHLVVGDVPRFETHHAAPGGIAQVGCLAEPAHSLAWVLFDPGSLQVALPQPIHRGRVAKLGAFAIAPDYYFRKGIDLLMAAFARAFPPSGAIGLVIKDMGSKSFSRARRPRRGWPRCKLRAIPSSTSTDR